MLKLENLSTVEIGKYGESLAKEFIKNQGYKIVLSNFSIRLGRNFLGHPLTGEIDIIAYDQETLCFIEVKTRTTKFLTPEKAVDLRKQRQITRVAMRYKQIFQLIDQPTRFDVIGILLVNNTIDINLEKGFFSPKLKPHYSWQGFS